MATCDVNSLFANAQCFACLSPGEWQILELQLLCEILAAGGGGGGGGASGEVLFGHYGGNPPPSPPANPASAAVNYDLDSPFTLWKWDGAHWT